MRSSRSKKFDIKNFVFNIVIQSLIITLVVCIAVVFTIKRAQIQFKFCVPLILLFLLTLIAFYFARLESERDMLSKLPNTHSFTISLLLLSVQKKFHLYAGVFINLKNFKFINRKVGSGTGDEVIQKYAKSLKGFLVKGEKIGHLGGDNFVVLVYKHRLDDLLEYLDKVNIYVEVDGKEQIVPVEARTGLYSLNESTTISDIFNNTSIALNYAKAHSFNKNMWFSQHMAEELYEEKEIAFKFQDAIKNHDFEVYYQPIVDVVNNKMCGAEALVRWNQSGKVILPEDFVPRLENNGLISQLDFYVLNQVCQDISEWKARGLNPVVISTNFSKANLKNPDFAVNLLEAINASETDKSLLEIEITESSDDGDNDVLKEFLETMEEQKIGITIDDFGVGYSSLELLKNKNVKTVKIDKSFIEYIEKNNGDNTDSYLVRNIIHTCYDLRKKIVCEGVENEAQKKLLTNMRCTIIQGFYYSKPLQKTAFEKYLTAPFFGDEK